MILPTKGLAADRALLSLGAEILRRLDRPKTISRLWEELRRPKSTIAATAFPYDWFVLGLDLLFIVGAVDLRAGQVRRRAT